MTAATEALIVADDDDEEDEEEEHLAPTDSTTLPVVDPVPSAKDIEAFEIDESASTPTHTSLPFSRGTTSREDVLEADVPPRKRLCLTALTPRFEVGESSLAVIDRQPGLDVLTATDYSFVDTMDATLGMPYV
ncbi:hypothetical protein Tco_0987352 [Tanacetum coccineum]